MFNRAKISVIGVMFFALFFYGSACGQEPQAAPSDGTAPATAVEQPAANESSFATAPRS